MADTLDIITIGAAKNAINMTAANEDHDDEIARQITAISRLVDKWCGPVVQRTVTGELHETDGTDIVLHWSPVASFTSVVEDQLGSIGTLTAHGFGGTSDGYYPEPDWRDPTLYSGVLQRRYLGVRGSWPSGAMVKVTYTAGRYADTGSVDARFVECAGAILRRLWKRESATWMQSSSYFEDIDDQTTPSPGFFRVAKPMIDEMLGDEKRLPGVA